MFETKGATLAGMCWEQRDRVPLSSAYRRGRIASEIGYLVQPSTKGLAK